MSTPRPVSVKMSVRTSSLSSRTPTHSSSASYWSPQQQPPPSSCIFHSHQQLGPPMPPGYIYSDDDSFMRLESGDTLPRDRWTFGDSVSRTQIYHYLLSASGHVKPKTRVQMEHPYARNWNIHPNVQLRVHPAKYLFMKDFPYHETKQLDEINSKDEAIDVVAVDDEVKKVPFLCNKPPMQPVMVDMDFPEISETITESWSCEKNKLWTRANKILNNDRVARLTYEGHVNEVLLKRNLLEHTSNKIRELLGSTFWDSSLISWLHQILLEYLDPNYKTIYLDALQVLRFKIPELVETILPSESKTNPSGLPLITQRPQLSDPLINTLNHFKPKKLEQKPVFLMVPFAPNFNISNSPRMKNWVNLLNAMGKVIMLPCVSKSNDLVSHILNEIRFNICDKIRTCRSNYAGRPLILVGFNVGSLIAMHCALQFPRALSAIICLGFPLYSLNGPRGELSDPFLELSVPIQFVIGENSRMASLDELEDLRERMVSAETSLIVVGGSDDRLVVSNQKLQRECLTQTLVDRMVMEEIGLFLEEVLRDYREELHDARHISQQPSLLAQDRALQQTQSVTPQSGRRRSGGGNSTRKRQVVVIDGEKTPEKPKRKRAYRGKKIMQADGTLVTPPSTGVTPLPKHIGSIGALPPVATNTPTAIPPEVIQNFHADPEIAAMLETGIPVSKRSFTQSTSSGTMIDINRSGFGSLKVEKPKEDSNSAPGTPNTSMEKKKKTLGGNSINFSLSSANLPTINEETSPIKAGMIKLTYENVKAISPLILKNSVEAATTEESKLATADAATELPSPPGGVSTQTVVTAGHLVNDLTMPPQLPHKDSYQIEGVPVLPMSASRTGRPIKPPKSLNMA